MPEPATVREVVDGLRRIDEELPARDGAAVFNRVYLTVTERIADSLAAGAVSRFADNDRMAELDVRFASLWLDAYETDAAGREPSPCWTALFESRSGGRLPIQYAVAGLNSHIEHDLPLAVVRTCDAIGIDPSELRSDYEAVNDVLAEVEADIRRSFLDSLGRDVDNQLEPVAHLVSAWSIDKAREVAWVTAQTLWQLRDTRLLYDAFSSALAHTVGMASRTLLTPAPLLPE